MALQIQLRTFEVVNTQLTADWPAPGAPVVADPIWTSAHIGIYIGIGKTQTLKLIKAEGFPAPKKFPVKLKGRRWDKQDIEDWFKQLPHESKKITRERPSVPRVKDLPTAPNQTLGAK